MAAYIYNPAPGAQNPTRYPVAVGPNYRRYGEQAGYVYDPYTDKYRADPNAQKKLLQDQGVMPKDQSLMSQALPAVVTAAAPILGKEIIGMAASKLPGLLGGGTSAATNAVASTANGGALLADGVTAADGVATAANGGTILADGSVVGGSTPGLLAGAAPYLGVAGAGLGAYGVHNAIENNDVGSGALSGAGFGLGLGAAAPLLGFGPLGWGALGLMALGGAGLGGGLTGLLGKESLADRSKKRWGKLSDGATDAAYKAMLDKGAADTLSKNASSWDLGDDINAAPIDELRSSYGVLKTFGPEWAALNAAQQDDILRKMVAANLLNNKKGEFEVTDDAAARALLGGAGAIGGSAFDASGARVRDWQPGDAVYGGK